MRKFKIPKQILNKIFYTALGISLALIFIPRSSKIPSPAVRPQVLGTVINSSQEFKASPELATRLNPPVLSAKAAFAFDLTTKSILYAQNLDEQLPIASLTKLMTALVVVEHTDPNQTVVVDKAATKAIGATMGLAAGEKILVKNLLSGMLIASSNDATLALSDFLASLNLDTVGLMNEKAKNLGLVQTHFANPVGWDSTDNYSSAQDLAKITGEFVRHQDLSALVQTKLAEVSSVDGKYVHELTTTNKLLLEDPSVTGIKTGYTSKALGSLIARIKRGDADVVTIVLDSQNRENDSTKLIDWIFQVYQW